MLQNYISFCFKEIAHVCILDIHYSFSFYTVHKLHKIITYLNIRGPWVYVFLFLPFMFNLFLLSTAQLAHLVSLFDPFFTENIIV